MYIVVASSNHEVRAIARIRENFEHSCKALEFLKSVANQKQYGAAVRGMRALFNRFAESGKSNLTHEMLHEVDKNEEILSFVKGDLRVYCFRDGSHIVLTHGAIKKTQKVDQGDITSSVSAKKQYFEETGSRKQK